MPYWSVLLFYILIGLVVYIILTTIVCNIVINRKDDTPFWEPIVLSIFFTPILALLVEALKPYKPYKPYTPITIKKEKPKKVYKSATDISDEDLQKYLYLNIKNGGK